MTTVGRKCVWCGSAANSKEHVYPQWLRRFDGPSNYIAEHGSYHEPLPRLVARPGPDGRLVEYEAIRAKQMPNLHEVQVKAVCRDCNSGWMSRLETDIEPIVSRLVRGRGVGLSPEEALTLSTWAHKTFLMYDLWEELPDRRYRQEDYHAFYAARLPQGELRLYIAASNSPFANFAMWSDSRRLIPGGVDAHSYVAANGINCGSSYFAVDGVVVIEHWFAPDYPSADPAGRFIRWASHRKMRKLGAQEIWPQHDESKSWPRRVLTRRQTEAARLSLFNALRPLPVHARRTTPP